MSHDEESLVLFIREFLNLTIDRLLPVVKYCINKKLSRSALGRFIKRKELKNKKRLTYLQYSSSHNFDCQLKNKNVTKKSIIEK